MSSDVGLRRRAAAAVGRALGRTLRRYEDEPGGDDSLDYIDDASEVYEMKTVTPQEYQELRAARTRYVLIQSAREPLVVFDFRADDGRQVRSDT